MAGKALVTAALGRAGILILNNAHVVIGRSAGPLVLAGVGEQPNIARALGGLEGQRALCLVHRPDLFARLPAPCALGIAGHTHGGQVALPLLGRLALEHASLYGERYAKGVIRENGHVLFVSPGIGTNFLPVRLGVPPEISLLKIQ